MERLFDEFLGTGKIDQLVERVILMEQQIEIDRVMPEISKEEALRIEEEIENYTKKISED